MRRSFKRVEGLNYPAQSGFAIALDTDMNEPARALWIGAAGNLRVTFVDGSVVTLPNVSAGVILSISVKRIHSSGTTIASPTTNIVGLR